MKKQQERVDIDTLIDNHKKRITGPKCRVCIVLKHVPPDWTPKLEAVLQDRERFSGAGVAAILTELEIQSASGMPLTVSGSSVDRHRRGDCSGTA